MTSLGVTQYVLRKLRVVGLRIHVGNTCYRLFSRILNFSYHVSLSSAWQDDPGHGVRCVL
jgi:hypothetical protein